MSASSSEPGSSRSIEDLPHQPKNKKTKTDYRYLPFHNNLDWTKEEVLLVLSAPKSEGGAQISKTVTDTIKLSSEASYNGNWLNYVLSTNSSITSTLNQLVGEKYAEDNFAIEMYVKNRLGSGYWKETNEQLRVDLKMGARLSTQEAKFLQNVELNSKYIIRLVQLVLDDNIEVSEKLETLSLQEMPLTCFTKIVNWVHTQCCVKVTPEAPLIQLSAEEARQRQAVHLISASDIMPFLGGETLASNILPHLQSRFRDPGVLGTDKVSHPILFITGSTGTGKTRNAMEYLSCVHKSLTDTTHSLWPFLENKFELYLRINYNGLKIDSFPEIDSLASKGESNFEKFVVVRLFYTFLTMYYKGYTINPIQHAQSLTNQYPTVSKCVLYLKSLLYKDSPKAMIHIVIDEFQLLRDYSFNAHDRKKSYLEQICNCLGSASCSLATSNIMLICTLAGTHYTPLSDVIRTSIYQFQGINPTRPRMSILDILYFVEYYIATCTSNAKLKFDLTMENYYVHTDLLKCINVCYNMPRKVEYLMTSLRTCGNWEGVSTSIKSYSLSQTLTTDIRSISEIVYAYSITEKLVTRNHIVGNGITVANLEESGWIVLIPHPTKKAKYVIHLRFPYLMVFGQNNPNFNRFNDCLQKILDEGGAYRCNATNLETLNAYFEVVLNECYLLLGVTKLKFRERYRGMIPSKQIISSGIWDSDIIVPSNMNYESVTQNAKLDDKNTLYHYSKMQNKKGCDRISFLNISNSANHQDTTEYTLQYQDRGIDLNSATTHIKGGDVAEEWKENKTSVESILFYCSFKAYTHDLVKDLWIDSKNSSLFNKNLMILGIANSSAVEEFKGFWERDCPCIGLQYYYGSQLYDLLFQISLPKIMNVHEISSDDRRVLSLVFGTTIDTELDNLVVIMKDSTSLENFEEQLKQHALLAKFSSVIQKRFKDTITTDSTKITLSFAK